MTPRKAKPKTKKQSKTPKMSKARSIQASHEILDLKAEGDRLHQAYEHPEAVDAYTRALDLGHEQKDGLDPALEYDLHKGRAECFGYLGDVHSEVADLEAMAALAEAMDDLGLRIQVVALRRDAFGELGRSEEDVRAATNLLEAARTTGDRALLADSLCALGWAYTGVEDAPNCELYLGQALEIYRELGNLRGEAMCLMGIGQADAFVGRVEQALEKFTRAMGTFRSLGDRRWASKALSSVAINLSDQADRRAHYEDGIATSRAIGDRVGEALANNNLAMLYFDLGLYNTAHRYIESALQTVREMGHRNRLATFVESLGRIFLGLGKLDQAKAAYQEVLNIALELRQRWAEGYALLGLGLTQLRSGLPEDSLDKFQSALEKFEAINTTPELAATLSYIGSAQLALGDCTAALESTRQAVKFLHEAENKSTNFPPHFIWWIRHRALKASEESNNRDASGANGSDGGDEAVGGNMGDQAWDALQRAYEFTLAGIENLSDQGLRRSYLNKVEINREIVIRRNEEAMARGLPPADESPRTGNLQEQLKRMLAIGLQLNERRTADELTQFIMSQFVELSGAERSALILTDESGDRQLAAEWGFSREGKPAVLDQLSMLLDDVAASQHAALKQNVSPDDLSEPSAGFMDAVSILCVPLIAHDQLLGMLYGDNHAVFGRFGEADLDLLSAFANQAASAIENARLYQGLEDRVAERTAELNQANTDLEQRAAELAVINSVQEGLASKLDFQAIIELVGQKIMQVFESEGIGIRIYDPDTDLVHYPFEFENGKRLPAYPPQAAIGVSGYIIQTRQPLMLNEDLDQWLEEHGATILPGSERNKSCLGVPVVVKDEVRGLVLLENAQEDAFTEADKRLLSTIAASMGVALENARLFDETTRLLEETRQRNAELAVINKVQDALASKLDLAGIVEVVGEKVAEILSTGDLSIRLLSDDGRLLITPYYIEHGDRYPIEPVLVDEFPFPARALRTGKAVTASKEELEAAAKQRGSGLGDQNSPMPATELFLPFMSGGKPVGLMTVADFEHEDAYGDSEISLLTTLANSMSVALENARLFDQTNQLLEETRQRNAELAVINSVQEGLASKLDLAGVIEVVGEEIAKIFAGHDVKISLLNEDGSQFITPYLLEHGERFPAEPFPSDIASWSSRVVESRKPLVLGQTDLEAGHSSGIPLVGDMDAPFPKSELRLPILSGDKALGVITLGHRERDDVYGESEINLLMTLANSMSVALENARLFDETNRLLEETRHRNAELAVINSVGEALAAKLEIQGIYDAVGDKLHEVFPGSQVVDILSYDSAQDLFTPHYVLEREKRFDVKPWKAQGFRKHVVETGQPMLINHDVERMMKEYDNPVIVGEQSKSLVVVPMKIGDDVIGVITLQHLDEENAFTDSDVSLLQTLASSMSVALENAHLFEETSRLLDETRQRNAELAVINSVQEGLANQLDMQAIFDLLGDTIQEVFDAQTVMIVVAEGDQYRFPYIIERGERLHQDPHPGSSSKGFGAHVMQTFQPLMINEGMEAKSAEYGSIIVGGGEMPKSGIYVPLFSGSQARGFISIQNIDRENAFSNSDLRLLTTLASSMSVALENARLFEETQHRAAEMTAISTVSQALVAESDLDRILKLVGEQVRGIFEADIAYVAVHEPDTNLITFPYMHGEDDVTSIPFGSGLTSEIIRSGEPLLLNRDIDEAAAQLNTERAGRKAASYLGVPIFVGGQAIGVVSVQSTAEEERFDEADVRLLSTIAANAGAAIGSARLYEETKQRASELAAINVIGEGLLSQMDVDRVVELVGDSISQIFENDQIGIAICDYEAQKIHIPYFLVDGERLPSYDMDMGDGLASVVVETKQPLRLNNWEELRQHGAVVHPDFKDPLPEENSWLGVPIMSGTEVSGVIFSNANRSNAFSEADQRLLSTIAANMGVAIRNAQLYGETQRRAEEMAALNEIGREASATLDLETVLQRISSSARKILDANTASVILLDENGKSLHPISAEGTLADEVMAFTWELGEGLVGGIVQSGKAERIHDVISDPRMIELPGTQKSVEGEKLLVAPLISREASIGAIAAWRGVTDPVFSPEDLTFVVGLAQQATIAIQNARLFEETQREKQYSEGLVLNSPVAIITTDLEAQVVSWNPAAERLFGYTVDEAIGRNLDGLIATDDIHDEAVGFTEKVWDEGRVNAVTRRARKDGSLVDVELLALPVTVEGAHSGLIAIYHDITELLAAQKEAEDANQAKSAFLATMSHEIRTPMNAVIGMSGLLLDTELGDEQREFAEIIRNSGDALLGIINDVLDFSKIEAGKMELEYQPFDLRECIEGTLDLVATRAFDKGLDIAYVLEKDIPAGIVGDVTRLRQIILNLLTNAVKFTEEGEVVLTVQPGDSLEPPSDGDGSSPSASSQILHFSVRDTGIGIPVERMDRLFQSFSQVDASTARKYGGTGLGLAISKRLSEMMGGTMWVESEMDVGTTFHFSIKAEPSSETTPATRRMEHSEPGLQGRRVLVVDDNDTNRRILTLQTKGWGMIPVDTESPKTALKWIRKGDPFDVAILDMNMPEMDGMALAGEIRKVRDADDLPLILFTSLGRREVGQDEVGFAAFLTKPIKPSHLFDTLVAIFADQPVAPRRPSSEGKRTDPDMAKRHPLRILLAEDNAVNQKLATRLLAQMGYRADVAANGLEAIDALERQQYDLVLMDVQMPEMDGLEASRQINKQWSRDQRPQIVAMTANAMQGDRELCMAAGMDDYITKPIRVEELVAALERVPGGRRQGEDA